MRRRLDGQVSTEKADAIIEMIRQQYNTYHSNAAKIANDLNTKEWVFKIEKDLLEFDVGVAIVEAQDLGTTLGRTTAFEEQCAQKVRGGLHRPTGVDIKFCNAYYRSDSMPFQEPAGSDLPPQTLDET